MRQETGVAAISPDAVIVIRWPGNEIIIKGGQVLMPGTMRPPGALVMKCATEEEADYLREHVLQGSLPVVWETMEDDDFPPEGTLLS